MRVFSRLYQELEGALPNQEARYSSRELEQLPYLISLGSRTPI